MHKFTKKFCISSASEFDFDNAIEMIHLKSIEFRLDELGSIHLELIYFNSNKLTLNLPIVTINHRRSSIGQMQFSRRINHFGFICNQTRFTIYKLNQSEFYIEHSEMPSLSANLLLDWLPRTHIPHNLPYLSDVLPKCHLSPAGKQLGFPWK